MSRPRFKPRTSRIQEHYRYTNMLGCGVLQVIEPLAVQHAASHFTELLLSTSSLPTKTSTTARRLLYNTNRHATVIFWSCNLHTWTFQVLRLLMCSIIQYRPRWVVINDATWTKTAFPVSTFEWYHHSYSFHPFHMRHTEQQQWLLTDYLHRSE
jgi:hypothetical protein